MSNNLNPYIMFNLSCVAEIIGYSLCVLNEKFSRKIMLVCFISISSLCCLLVTIVPNDELNSLTWKSYLMISFATIGKATVSASMGSLCIYTFRMFPTKVRNTLFAVCISSARIGSMIAPSINLLRLILWEPAPYMIFSGNAIIAAITIFFLPDPSKLTF